MNAHFKLTSWNKTTNVTLNFLSSLLHEYQQHFYPIQSIAITPNGCLVYTMDSTSHICSYDALNEYKPLQIVASFDSCSNSPSIVNRSSLSISDDGKMLAALGPDSLCVLIFQVPTLKPTRKVNDLKLINIFL